MNSSIVNPLWVWFTRSARYLCFFFFASSSSNCLKTSDSYYFETCLVTCANCVTLANYLPIGQIITEVVIKWRKGNYDKLVSILLHKFWQFRTLMHIIDIFSLIMWCKVWMIYFYFSISVSFQCLKRTLFSIIFHQQLLPVLLFCLFILLDFNHG